MYDKIETPAVVVELNIAQKNIREMVENNKRYGIGHRPHIKAHKSLRLARMQLDAGAIGITCAKLGEAEVFAEGGIRDILLAFPVIGRDKLERYGKLTEICSPLTIVNSVEGAKGLSDLGVSLHRTLDVLIELDGGIRRGGVPPMEPALAYARMIRDLPGIRIVGLMYYGGLIYAEKTEEGIARMARKERDDLLNTKALLEKNGFTLPIVSGGSSFSAKCPENLEGITEVRAGNYIFNDGAQLYIKKVRPEDCALRVAATVVSRVDDCSVIIDAGSKTLTSDTCACGTGFGYVMGHEDIVIYKLNEEHGYLKSENPIDLKIGEKIAVIPNHACVVPNLTDRMVGLRDGVFDSMIRVDARGRNR